MARHKIGIGIQAGFMPPIEGIVKNARQNEDQGYHSLWWSDHLMAWTPESIWTPDVGDIAKYVPNPHAYLDPIASMAAVATSTSTVRLGTSVTEILRRHPAMLAQEFLSLDHISKGRVILGLGAGEGENTVPYGVDFTYTASKVDEALQVIRLLWSTDEPVDFEGRFFKLKKAVFGLRPYGEKAPPIWLAAMGPRMLDICARHADGWLPTFMPVEDYGRKLAHILELAKGYGRDTAEFHGSLWTYLVVDEDHEECHRLLENPIIKNYAMIAPTEMFARHGSEHPLGPDVDRTSRLHPHAPRTRGGAGRHPPRARGGSPGVHHARYARRADRPTRGVRRQRSSVHHARQRQLYGRDVQAPPVVPACSEDSRALQLRLIRCRLGAQAAHARCTLSLE